MPVVSVSGTVTDSNGAPVPNVGLYASMNQYPSYGRDYSSVSITTDTQGAYAYLITRGSGNFQVTPPSATGFLQVNVPFSLSSDLTQRIILQRPDLSPPQIVAGPVVVHLSDTSVSVSWTTNESSTSRVEYGIGSLTTTTNVAALSTNHAVTLLNLAPQATYIFRVGSVDAAGNGPTYSPNGTFNTLASPGDITPPIITSGPTVVFVDQTTAIVEWTTDEPATSALAFGPNQSLGSSIAGPATTFTQPHSMKLTGLSPQTTYYAQVTSEDPNHNKIQSSVFTFATLAVPDTTPPVITAGPTVLSTTDTTITVVWTTNEPATSGVSYNDGSHFNLVSDAALTRDHQTTLSGLSSQTSYSVTVSSTDAVGNGPTLGGPVQATTAATPDTAPPVISGLQVTDLSQTTATVRWTTDERANSVVTYGTASGAPDNSAADVALDTTHRMLLTGLRDSTRYFLTVTSTDGSSNLAASPEISFTTLPPAVDLPPTAPGPISAPGGTDAFRPVHDFLGRLDRRRRGRWIRRVQKRRQHRAGGGADHELHGVGPGGRDLHLPDPGSDSAGHVVASGTITVIVDRTAPVVTVPSNIVVTTTSTTATVNFTASATDTVDGPLAVGCTQGPGDFPAGDHDGDLHGDGQRRQSGHQLVHGDRAARAAQHPDQSECGDLSGVWKGEHVRQPDRIGLPRGHDPAGERHRGPLCDVRRCATGHHVRVERRRRAGNDPPNSVQDSVGARAGNLPGVHEWIRHGRGGLRQRELLGGDGGAVSGRER